MTCQSDSDLLRPNADAVVAHAYQTAAAALQFDVDAPCGGVQGILDQLLDHGRRPLDYLAGSDLVDEFVG
jgi:hypothetical protein